MYKIIPDAKFPGSITFKHRGVVQTLEVVFRHRTRTQFSALLEKVKDKDGKFTVQDILLDLLESWDADQELSRKALVELEDNQPGACWSIVNAYGDGLIVERQGN